MTKQQLRSNLLLLLGAAIWGFAFVAQRVGMRYIGAFTFNGVRFALGAFSLLPLLAVQAHQAVGEPAPASAGRHPRLYPLLAGGLLGCVLFSAASLQQIGLYTTTAGKAGFITGMYILLVPVFGLFLGRRNPLLTWLGVLVAAAGLYLISVTGAFTVARGDLYELAGACLFAVHIMLVDVFSKRIPALLLSLMQFVVCAALSLAAAGFTERITLSGILAAAVPLLYGGILSVGVAYTLQIVGQKHAQPAVASILMSFESVFSCIGGILLLHETLTPRGGAGCLLMVAGMILSQAPSFLKSRNAG